MTTDADQDETCTWPAMPSHLAAMAPPPGVTLAAGDDYWEYDAGRDDWYRIALRDLRHGVTLAATQYGNGTTDYGVLHQGGDWTADEAHAVAAQLTEAANLATQLQREANA